MLPFRTLQLCGFPQFLISAKPSQNGILQSRRFCFRASLSSSFSFPFPSRLLPTLSAASTLSHPHQNPPQLTQPKAPFHSSLPHFHGSHSHFPPRKNDPNCSASPQVGAKDALRARNITLFGLGVNIFFGATKSAAGIVSGSASLTADAFHTLSDLFSDLVTLFALQYSSKPPTANFPFGFGQFETVASLMVTAFLLSSSAALALHSGSLFFAEPSLLPPQYTLLALSLTALSVLVKEGLYHATEHIAQKINSPVLHANAWHHRVDGLSAVVALAGLGGNICGIHFIDPLGGIFIALMIIKPLLSIGYQNLRELAGGGASQLVVHEISTHAAQILRGSHRISHIRIRSMGPHYIAHLDVAVDPTQSALQIQAEFAHLRQALYSQVPSLKDIILQFVPQPSLCKENHHHDCRHSELTAEKIPKE